MALPTTGLILNLDAQAFPVLPIGSPIITWPDQSGQGNNGVRNTNGGVPQYIPNAMGYTPTGESLPAIRFPGAGGASSWFGCGTAPFNITSYTICIVARWREPFTNVAMCGKNDSNVATPQRRTMQVDRMSMFQGTDTDTAYIPGHGIGPSDPFFQTVVVTNGSPIPRMFCNGLEVPAGFTASLATGQTNGQPFQIGMPWGTTTAEAWVGDIAQVLVYNTVLSSDDLEQLHQFIAARWFLDRTWGLGFNPADSYFCSSASKLRMVMDTHQGIPLSAQIDGSDCVTMYEPSQLNNTVLAWNNTGSPAPNRPKIRTNALNGLTVLEFPVSSNSAILFQQGSNLTMGPGYTGVMVMKPWLIGGAAFSVGTTLSAGNDRRQIGMYGDRFVSGSDTGGCTFAAAGAAYVGNNAPWSVVGVKVVSATEAYSLINDGPITLFQTFGASFHNTVSVSVRPTLGCTFQNFDGEYWHGQVAFVVWYNELLSDAKFRSLVNVIGWRFGFPWGTDPQTP